MMGERGVSADHSTIYRWVQRYAPYIEKRLRWQWRVSHSTSWRVDETDVKVRGHWNDLYGAVGKFGNTIDFYRSPTRNIAKALNGLKAWEKPSVIDTDKAPTYAAIKGFEVMYALRKGQAPAFTITRDIRGEARIVERTFGFGVFGLAEAAQFVDECLQQEAV